MSGFVCLLDLLKRGVGIDLRRGEAGVPEQGLNSAYIRAVVEHCGGERVA